ncbi:class I SAM-dependent methyltransferase [Carnobacterium maltaromaticum]|uniref:class I SAM-dependent methyltransferase n=1 Tax=Carnobacterium maltaromaticum TaxID=2751 RepID=UPI0039BEA86B
MENNEDRVKNTYKKICLYDKIMDLPWWAKLAGNVVWGFHTIGFIEKLLSDIPDDFDGELLDIPAGSSNFTLEKYKKLKNCTISSVDYSSEMLKISKRKFEKENLMQIKFYEESVYALPFKDSHFDYILTMNGFHVFAEKKAAFEELYRVLQTGGIISGCFYIQDQRYLTDLIIKTCFVPFYLFSPPFYSFEEVRMFLEDKFSEVSIKNQKSMVYFSCKK